MSQGLLKAVHHHWSGLPSSCSRRIEHLPFRPQRGRADTGPTATGNYRFSTCNTRHGSLSHSLTASVAATKKGLIHRSESHQIGESMCSSPFNRPTRRLISSSRGSLSTPAVVVASAVSSRPYLPAARSWKASFHSQARYSAANISTGSATSLFANSAAATKSTLSLPRVSAKVNYDTPLATLSRLPSVHSCPSVASLAAGTAPTRQLFSTQAYVSNTNTTTMHSVPKILLFLRTAPRKLVTPVLRRSLHTTRVNRFKVPGGASSSAPVYDEGAKKAAQSTWRDSMRLLSLARPEAKMLGVGLALLIISSGISMTVPFAMGKIIDIVTHPGQHLQAFGLTLPQMFLGLTGVFVVGSLANAGRVMIMRVSGERIVVRLRQRLFESIAKQDIAFFDANKTGDLISRLSLDTNVVGKSLTFNIADGLRSVIMATSGVTMMTYVSPQLTAIMMCIVPPVAIGAVYYGRYVKSLSKQTQEALGEITKVAEERIGNIRTVRAFAKEDDELQRYSLRVQDVFALAKKEALASATFFSLAGFSGNMTILAILYSGGSMVMDGSLSVGELTSHLMYTLYVGSSLAGLTSFYSEIMKGIGAGSRLFELLDKKPTIALTGGVKLDKLTGEIKFDNVVFTYPTRKTTPIFDAISFDVKAGEVVAICGQSGIGKSTCGSLLLRFYDPDAGRILINGNTDLRDVDVRWWRDQVGLVSQEPVLFGGTIYENIAYGVPDATPEQVQEVAAKANCGFIHEFPDKFQTMVGERGISLSGGQKQRISIARALLKNPQILVLDEATSALDSHSEQLVQEALDRLMEGRTVLTIAHRESTIRSADKVICLEAGRVAEVGTYDELMQSEKGVFRALMQKRDL